MEDISLHILDIAQNSIAAGASRVEISIREFQPQDLLDVTIRDNGSGMDEEQVKKVTDPFYTTRKTRKVGLGLPLFKASAEASGGCMEIHSRKGTGTAVQALFHTGHIDCLPMGKMEDTITTLIFCNPDVDFSYRHEYCGRHFMLDTREIREQLGEVSITTPDVLDWIKDFIKEGLDEIYGGVSK
jgi:hypothetical protein